MIMEVRTDQRQRAWGLPHSRKEKRAWGVPHSRNEKRAASPMPSAFVDPADRPLRIAALIVIAIQSAFAIAAYLVLR